MLFKQIYYDSPNLNDTAADHHHNPDEFLDIVYPFCIKWGALIFNFC